MRIRNDNIIVSLGNLNTNASPPVDLTDLRSVGQNPVQQIIKATENQNVLSDIRQNPHLDVVSRYKQDILIFQENKIGNNDQEINSGLYTLRPELISLMDFVPLFLSDNPTKVDDFFNIMYQMRILRDNNIENIKKKITENSILNNLFIEIQNDLNGKFSDIKKILNFYLNNIKQINSVKTLFDLHPIFLTTKANYLSLQDFLERKMLFTKDSIDTFSDTKILCQLLFDFRSILENYSVSLLNLVDNDRVNDFDPIKIDKTYSKNSFSIESIRSSGVVRNAANEKEFNSFLSSLPANPEERNRLLITILSKELRISRGLSKTIVRRKIENFFKGTADGNPFDNIVGTVGGTIFEKPQGENSLASTMFIELDNNQFVLPFEQKFIEDGKTTFIPGTKYFADTILQLTNGKFNTVPLKTYSQSFKNVVNESITTLNELFDFQNRNLGIAPKSIINSFYGSLKLSIDSIKDENTTPNSNQLTIAALFKLSNSDRTLKLMVFQFLILAGIITSKNDDKKIFVKVISDVKTIQGLSFTRIDRTNDPDNNGSQTDPDMRNGYEELFPYMQQLAIDIEEKCFSLLTQIRRTPNNNVSIKSISYNKGTIRTALLQSVSNGNASTSKTTLVREFLNIANYLHTEASIQGNDLNYQLSDDSGRTRYNSVSTSYILLLVYEIINNLSIKYIASEFSEATNSSFKIEYNLQENIFIYDSLDKLTIDSANENFLIRVAADNISDSIFNIPNNTGTIDKNLYSTLTDNIFNISQGPSNADLLLTPKDIGNDNISNKNVIVGNSPLFGLSNGINTNSLISNQTVIDKILSQDPNVMKYLMFKNDLETTKNKIEEEDITIQNVMSILETISNRLNEGVQQSDSYFSRASNETILLSGEMQKNLFLSQVSIGNILFDKYSKENVFISIDRVNEPLKNLTEKFLKDSPFSQTDSDRKIKILSFGLPSGFCKTLSERIDKSKINKTTFKPQDGDLIRVKVWKRSSEYDDLVFYPQSFLFDTSLFLESNQDDIKITDQDTFLTGMKRFQLIDYSTGTKVNWDYDKIVNNEKYGALSASDRENLFKNHIVNDVLNTYSDLLSGISFQEENYLEQKAILSSIDNKMSSLITSYFRELKNINFNSIEDIFNGFSVPEIIKDEASLINLTINKKDIDLKQLITSPKSFDRVFSIPINLDSYVINITETMKTESGKKLLSNQKFKELMIENKIGKQTFYSLKRQKDLFFEDLFITVELVEP